jgi:hypothetical protein
MLQKFLVEAHTLSKMLLNLTLQLQFLILTNVINGVLTILGVLTTQDLEQEYNHSEEKNQHSVGKTLDM